jgi:hypothetical protein
LRLCVSAFQFLIFLQRRGAEAQGSGVAHDGCGPSLHGVRNEEAAVKFLPPDGYKKESLPNESGIAGDAFDFYVSRAGKPHNVNIFQNVGEFHRETPSSGCLSTQQD